MTSPQNQQPERLSDLAFWFAVQHQDEQQRIADKAAAGLALLWRILNFDDLDGSTPAWLHAATLQVEQDFRRSERAAFEYVQSAKWAVEPLSVPLDRVETVFPVADFQLAMRATGPAAVKQATRKAFSAPVVSVEALADALPVPGVGPPVSSVRSDAMALGLMNSTGVAVKQVLNGGRGEVQQLVAADAVSRSREGRVVGYARFTEDSENGPCYFCALLASQGAVFLSRSSFDDSNGQFVGDGPAKVHDHCKCQLRPVYSAADRMDERARFFRSQWDAASGLKDFRRNYVKPPPYDVSPVVDLGAVRRNRDVVADRLGAGAPQVAWFDDTISRLSV